MTADRVGWQENATDRGDDLSKDLEQGFSRARPRWFTDRAEALMDGASSRIDTYLTSFFKY